MNGTLDPNTEKGRRIAYLIAGFLRQTISPEEHDELDRWVEESDENMMLFEDLTDEANLEASLQQLRAINSDIPYQTLRTKLPFVQEKKKLVLWPYVAAASIILFIAAFIFFEPFNKKSNHQIVAVNNNSDMQPGSNKATLTLTDGRKIILQDQQVGELNNEQNFKIVKDDSTSLRYNASTALRTTERNTLSTPAGGMYSVTLADGTKVWLNAASSLTYPIAFGDAERLVELTGEAYFEVAHDKSKPFLVRSNGQEVKVLGTRFNVSAYEGEEAVTTLVEGSVQLTTHNTKKLLKPGEEIKVALNGGVTTNTKADIETTLAWKNGLFKFKDASIRNVMNQVARWYDATIVYNGSVDHHFNGEIERSLPVSKVLALLKKTGRVQFELKDKTIIVKP